MKLNNHSKVRILENFYAIDKLFFGDKPISELKTCCPSMIEEYVINKGTLLSIMTEMFKLTKHNPSKENLSESYTKIKKPSDLVSLAENTSKIAKENIRELIDLDETKNMIKENVKEQLNESEDEVNDETVKEIVDENVHKVAFSLALDNMLIGRTLGESEEPEKLNEMEGFILEDAYKVLRDSLLESALGILDMQFLGEDDSDDEDTDE